MVDRESPLKVYLGIQFCLMEPAPLPSLGWIDLLTNSKPVFQGVCNPNRAYQGIAKRNNLFLLSQTDMYTAWFTGEPLVAHKFVGVLFGDRCVYSPVC